MTGPPLEPDLHLVDEDPADDGGDTAAARPVDADVENLRDEFVEAFNARDLEALQALVSDDVDVPDALGDGPDALADELEAIWARSPGALLTRGLLDDAAVAVAWLPDEEDGWSRAALVCFDADDGLLSCVELCDDPDALDRVVCEDPDRDDVAEGADWREWEDGVSR